MSLNRSRKRERRLCGPSLTLPARKSAFSTDLRQIDFDGAGFSLIGENPIIQILLLGPDFGTVSFNVSKLDGSGAVRSVTRMMCMPNVV